MNWASSIPLASLLAAVFFSGLIVSEVRALRKEVTKLGERHDKDLTALGTRTDNSAAGQGRRIGNIESYLGLNADGVPVERLSRAHLAAGDDDGRVR